MHFPPSLDNREFGIQDEDMDILILGGNSFFGKSLAGLLIKEGHRVTLLNRGNKDDGFGDQVQRIKCDRRDSENMERALLEKNYDLVFDQICFDAKEAKDSCRIFRGKTKRYIMTSTQSVYALGANLSESQFNAEAHRWNAEKTAEEDYGEAKRQAEAVFIQSAEFPVVCVRFPIVMGPEDPTQRLRFHVERVRQRLPIYFPNYSARLSLISQEGAAQALFFLGQSSFEGSINAASPEPIELSAMMEVIEKKVKVHTLLSETKSVEAHSPYGIDSDWFMSCRKLESLGLTLPPISQWFPALVERVS